MLYANNLVDIYRYKGISALVKAVENKLQTKNYWLNALENKDVTYGYFESQKFILFCVKNKKILDLYTYNNKLSKIKTFHVLTGLDGQKEKEGDLRTPIGVYKLKSFLTNIDSFYGPFAFATNYPNIFDQINNRDGHGIWIHGKPLDGKRDTNLTKGCIVLDNNDLEDLKEKINYQKTYLLISEDKPLTASKDEIASILAFLYKWRYAWKNNDFNKYKKFYDKNFKKSNGMDLKRFLNYKKRVFQNKKHQKVNIYFSNISIIPYQNINHDKIFYIDMNEKYLSDTYKYIGIKELYIHFTKSGIKIVAEK